MKRLISLFIIFAITTVACMSTAIASFVVGDINDTHYDMVNKPSSNCIEFTQKDCTSYGHECCIYPFSESYIISNLHTPNLKKEIVKLKILDFSFLAILQEKLENNYIIKLKSPPIEEYFGLNNSYITLTGIIKSNC